MDSPRHKRSRYRFAEYCVSPSQRVLLRDGVQVPLIPRYFDLLLLLLERRDEAVHRREILDEVWSDVVVSDGALNQAVRVLRRALGDDPREPRFIRTVSRHGYRFIFDAAIEEADEGPLPERTEGSALPGWPADTGADIDAAMTCLLDEGRPEAERRGAAEALHAAGTAEALRRLDRLPGHERARALLRDSRWDVPGAGPVPILGRPGAWTTSRVLVGMRIARAVRLAWRRWASGVAGGALAGLVAGALGGLVLRFGPGAPGANAVLLALPLVGLALGGVAAAGVGAGLAGAEVSFRSYRGPALLVLGALGGGAVGTLAHGVGLVALEGLFGRDLSPAAGGFEGLAIGAAAGLGYALATPRSEGGMATPHGVARLWAAVLSGLACAAAAILLTWHGSYLGALSLDLMARTFPGSPVGLDPLARLLGEPTPGPITGTVISGWEGLMFGFGTVLGLTRRPHPPD